MEKTCCRIRHSFPSPIIRPTNTIELFQRSKGAAVSCPRSFPPFSPARSVEYECLFSAPDFVSSMEDSDHVYFFFRESAVEYINCGKVNRKEITRIASSRCRRSCIRIHVRMFVGNNKCPPLTCRGQSRLKYVRYPLTIGAWNDGTLQLHCTTKRTIEIIFPSPAGRVLSRGTRVQERLWRPAQIPE